MFWGHLQDRCASLCEWLELRQTRAEGVVDELGAGALLWVVFVVETVADFIGWVASDA